MELELGFRYTGFCRYEMKWESAKIREIILVWTGGLEEGEVVLLAVFFLN